MLKTTLRYKLLLTFYLLVTITIRCTCIVTDVQCKPSAVGQGPSAVVQDLSALVQGLSAAGRSIVFNYVLSTFRSSL